MNKKDWTYVIILIVLVSAVASILSYKFAVGDVSFSPRTMSTTATLNARSTYTKAEVDMMLTSLNSQLRYGTESIIYEMLVRLDKCTVIKDKQTAGVVSCDAICQKTGLICVDADYQGTLRPCSDSAGSINTDRFCKCCGL